MIEENKAMTNVASRPQSIVVVAIATLGSTLVAYLLWGFVRFSAMSMHDMFGDVALPMFTGKLIQNRILFWALPTLSLITGVVLLAKRKHSSPNLLIYVSSFVFASVVAVTFTIVALAIPWMRLIGNKIGS